MGIGDLGEGMGVEGMREEDRGGKRMDEGRGKPCPYVGWGLNGLPVL